VKLTAPSRIGEKFLQWSDKSPPDDEILDSITLWWLTQSFPRAIYPYRQFFGAKPTFFHNDENFHIKKPFGYSWHPQELAPVPVALVKKVCIAHIQGRSVRNVMSHG
jgi:microsomal epoxide hydrolase